MERPMGNLLAFKRAASAIILHDNSNGLLRAFIHPKDRDSTVVQNFLADQASMAKSLQSIKDLLNKVYDVPIENIHTERANLEVPIPSPFDKQIA